MNTNYVFFRIGSLLVVSIFALIFVNCQNLKAGIATKSIIQPGLPNLKKHVIYEFEWLLEHDFKITSITLESEQKKEIIDAFDLLNQKTKKGFRVVDFNKMLPKGKYILAIKSFNLQTSKESIVIEFQCQGKISQKRFDATNQKEFNLK